MVRAEEGGGLLVGLRKMGLAHLKGLDRIPVYEVVDGAAWEGLPLAPAPGATLMEAIERDLAEGSGGAAPA